MYEGEFEDRLADAEAAQDILLDPSQMCEVAASALKVSGAGLVMSHQHVRLPVGASSEEVQAAEEIQATLGAGPCLRAEAMQSVLVADQDALAVQFPVYALELSRRTPYRATLSFPLVYAGASFAALNLYSDQPTWTLEDELSVIQTDVVQPIGVRLLLRQLRSPTRDEAHDVGLARRRVLVAAGLVRDAARVAPNDAIALLRGHAFRTDRFLDDVARDLVEGRLELSEVLDHAV